MNYDVRVVNGEAQIWCWNQATFDFFNEENALIERMTRRAVRVLFIQGPATGGLRALELVDA